MSENLQFDVIVIGGGIAGLVAANQAVDRNLKTLVLEKGESTSYPCNTRFAGGTYHACLRDVMTEPKVLAKLMVESSSGFISPLHAQVIALNASRVVHWLESIGMQFVQVSKAEHHRWAMAPQGRTQPGLSWKGLAGDVLLHTLAERFTQQGGQMIQGAKARSLISHDGACVGVHALLNKEGHSVQASYRSKGVFIADGGFQSNLDLLKKYITPKPQDLKQRGGATGFGDGLTMALELGAQTIGMSSFYGHTLSLDAMHIERLWPYPYLDSLVTAGVVVNANGKRFVDEGRGGVYVANQIAHLDEPLSTSVIFDDAIWNKAGKQGLIPANPHVPQEGGTVHQASSIEELAKVSAMDVGVLQETLCQYNESVQRNDFENTVSPSRSHSKHRPQAILQAPYYSIPMCVGITYTMGGLAVTPNSQVIHQNGAPIKGLYALGASSGGFEGGPEVTYVGGLIKGGVNAMVSIEHFHASLI